METAERDVGVPPGRGQREDGYDGKGLEVRWSGVWKSRGRTVVLPRGRSRERTVSRRTKGQVRTPETPGVGHTPDTLNGLGHSSTEIGVSLVCPSGLTDPLSRPRP